LAPPIPFVFDAPIAEYRKAIDDIFARDTLGAGFALATGVGFFAIPKRGEQ
jgi:hypothetical protein